MNIINAVLGWINAAWAIAAPTVETGMSYAGIVACCLVIGSVCCRIDSMRLHVSSTSWALIYGAWGVYAMGTLLDQLRGHPVDWYNTVGACAIVLYLFKTRRGWRHGAPRETQSGYGRLE